MRTSGLIVAGFLASLAGVSVSAAERPAFDAASGFRYDSNLGNADRAAEVEDAFFWQAEAGAKWTRAVGRDWRVAGRVFSGMEIPFEYAAFTMARVGVEAHATRKFGMGRDAPRLTAAVSFERDFFQDEQMTKWLLLPSVRYRHPLAGAWSVDALYRFDGNFARSELFSGTGSEGSLMVRWEPEGRWSFFGGYRLRYCCVADITGLM